MLPSLLFLFCIYKRLLEGKATHHEQDTRPNLRSCHTATFEGDVEKTCFFQAFCHNCWKVKKLQRLGHKPEAFFLKSRNLARTVLEPSRRNPVPRNLPQNPWFGTCPGNCPRTFPELPVVRNLPRNLPGTCGSLPPEPSRNPWFGTCPGTFPEPSQNLPEPAPEAAPEPPRSLCWQRPHS